MSVTLRVILIVCSIISCILCIKKIKQAKLKVENAIVWMLGSFLLIFMSIFSGVVEWCAKGLGFEAPVNFVFVIIIAFLLIEVYLNNLKITEEIACGIEKYLSWQVKREHIKQIRVVCAA